MGKGKLWYAQSVYSPDTNQMCVCMRVRACVFVYELCVWSVCMKCACELCCGMENAQFIFVTQKKTE